MVVWLCTAVMKFSKHKAHSYGDFWHDEVPFRADPLEKIATTAFPADQASVCPTVQVAFAGWCLAGGVSAVTGPLRGIRRAAICSAVYMAPWVGGGADVPLVNILKHIFRRIRPSAIAHHTFAFPSGCAVQHPTLPLSNTDARLRNSSAVP